MITVTDEKWAALQDRIDRLREIHKDNRSTDSRSHDYDAGKIAGFLESLELIAKE